MMKIDVQNYNVPDIIETEANEQMAIFQPCASSVLQTDKKEYVRAIVRAKQVFHCKLNVNSNCMPVKTKQSFVLMKYDTAFGIHYVSTWSVQSWFINQVLLLQVGEQ